MEAQPTCSLKGQTPTSAFPVCGVKTFTQGSVGICGNTPIPVPPCTGGANSFIATNKNPYWYKFTCYQTGTLSFVITPNTLSDDYDWQIFDITGVDPNTVFTDPSLFVACNWSGVGGLTGTADTASAPNQCASPNTYAAGGVSPFSKSPIITQGHTYLLLVSHYTDSQSGYTLTFSGGTASITDPNIPNYSKASGICGGKEIYLKLSKTVQCSSIAADGSDFTLSPTASVQSAFGVGCNTGFDSDSIIVQLNTPLSPNTYNILQMMGSDGNTLLDNCFNAVPLGTQTAFTITAQQLVKADFNYNIHYGCQQDTIIYLLQAQNATNWLWTFDNTTTSTDANPSIIYPSLGQKQIKLVASNSVCADSIIKTVLLDNYPPKAYFSAPEYICPSDAVNFTDSSIGLITKWFWDFGNGQTSTLQAPAAQNYPNNNRTTNYPIQLTVTDTAGCTNTFTKLLKAVPNCYIAVPSAFTPNGDGLNDFLYPLNAYKAINLTFIVYNRFGQIIFKTNDWTQKWDGTVNGLAQPSGTYIWTLTYTDSQTGEKFALKGTTVLIR
ncbi:MAG: gliding motility-associated C-terminal domain-containing protein [Bacteroidota bacterium]|nr:gliding motility-associated C-terminal domain-containing protein [Bacteroidota bacterium]